MDSEVRVFLDTSVLFAAVLSETGGARLILGLGEAQVVQVFVGPQVLHEADGVLERKAPESKVRFALLLDRARVRVAPDPSAEALAQAMAVTAYAPDARVLAEALAMGVDYSVTLDREHFVANPRTAKLPFAVGTPGDFLAWMRERLRSG
jgi:predicted nucleic acid-binding protein